MKKVILITGATDGLGKALVRVLSPDHSIIALAPNTQKLQTLQQVVTCDIVACDIRESRQCTTAVQQVIAKHTRIDVLIHCAGFWNEGALDTVRAIDIDHTISVNLTGAIHFTQAVIPHMKEQQSGRIIIINSQGGLYAKGERSIYTASKWGLTGFTKSLQDELAPCGITVTGIYPGKMNTRFFEKVGITKDVSDALEPSEVASIIAQIISLPAHIAIPELGIKHIKS